VFLLKYKIWGHFPFGPIPNKADICVFALLATSATAPPPPLICATILQHSYSLFEYKLCCLCLRCSSYSTPLLEGIFGTGCCSCRRFYVSPDDSEIMSRARQSDGRADRRRRRQFPILEEKNITMHSKKSISYHTLEKKTYWGLNILNIMKIIKLLCLATFLK